MSSTMLIPETSGWGILPMTAHLSPVEMESAEWEAAEWLACEGFERDPRYLALVAIHHTYPGGVPAFLAAIHLADPTPVAA